MFQIVAAHAQDFPTLLTIWEKSVRASHDFLTESDIAWLHQRIYQDYMPHLTIFYGTQDSGQAQGFIACQQQRIEMLFVDPCSQGSGLGKALVNFAVSHLGCREVDVNEQNPKALAFYQHLGFIQTGRSALDGQGRPHPLLHLSLAKSDPERLGSIDHISISN